jgi:hypothetical protein
MNKVVNSVGQILGECTLMLDKVDGCEFVDVNSLAKTLKEQQINLEVLFSEHPEKEREVSIAKAQVENTAIRLEFYMDVRLGLYTDRRKLRRFAETLYNDCRSICCELSANHDTPPSELVEWGARTRWAIEFFARSQHIIFETDEDDDAMIKSIVEEMKKFKKEVV